MQITRPFEMAAFQFMSFEKVGGGAASARIGKVYFRFIFALTQFFFFFYSESSQGRPLLRVTDFLLWVLELLLSVE